MASNFDASDSRTSSISPAMSRTRKLGQLKCQPATYLFHAVKTMVKKVDDGERESKNIQSSSGKLDAYGRISYLLAA
jgi:hypothetical protein